MACCDCFRWITMILATNYNNDTASILTLCNTLCKKSLEVLQITCTLNLNIHQYAMEISKNILFDVQCEYFMDGKNIKGLGVLEFVFIDFKYH